VAAKDPDAFIDELWGYAHALEMREHTWFKGVREHRWTRDQIVRAEIQHYLRVRCNPIFFGYIVAEVHVERARDHARGLLEAEASVAASAAHPLEEMSLIRLH